MDNKKVAIVTFVYKSPSQDDIYALQTYRKIFKTRDIYAVVPDNIDDSVCKQIEEYITSIIKFDVTAFKSNESYQIKICWNPDFYRLFQQYEYILIAQLDALAFRDDLDYWCNLNYDYIGAPWCNCGKNCKPPYDNSRVGNGGFSLRKVKTFIDKMSVNHGISPIPEDVQICRHLGLNIPNCHEAIHFSCEWGAEFQIIKNGIRPMGCHNWKRLYNNIYDELLKLNMDSTK